jgi:hypothetical protein
MPIPASKVRGRQLELETQWTRDRIEENARINRIRERVTAWRSLGWPGVTSITRRLLEYWTDTEREQGPSRPTRRSDKANRPSRALSPLKENRATGRSPTRPPTPSPARHLPMLRVVPLRLLAIALATDRLSPRHLRLHPTQSGIRERNRGGQDTAGYPTVPT